MPRSAYMALKNELFPTGMTDDIMNSIDSSVIINEMLQGSMLANGIRMVDNSLMRIQQNLKQRGFAMDFEKLTTHPTPISEIAEFGDVANMWNWKDCDQAGFSNDQTPSQVYSIDVEGVEMVLNLEVDTESKAGEPQVMAMKMWQAVTFARALSELSAGTIHLNMKNALMEHEEGYVRMESREPQMYPGHLYSWFLSLMKACVYTICNFMSHNCRSLQERKFHSKWTKVIGSTDKKVYDLHFLIGEYETKFASQCELSFLREKDKMITEESTDKEGYVSNAIIKVMKNAERHHHYPGKKNLSQNQDKYRPSTKFANIDTDDFSSFDFFLFDSRTRVHHGRVDGNGAPIHFFFTQRVTSDSWGKAVRATKKIKISNPLTEQDKIRIQSNFNTLVTGIWYLQDMTEFIDYAEKIWEDDFDLLLTGVMDWRVDDSVKVKLPKSWNIFTDSDRSNSFLVYNQYSVYYQILEPMVSEMENMYHHLIIPGKAIKWDLDTTRFHNDMSLQLQEFQKDINSHRLAVRTRFDSDLQQLPVNMQGLNLRDRLLFKVKEREMNLENRLEKYLEKFRSEYMVVFCKLVQCHSLISLQELATKYEAGTNKTLMDSVINLFAVAVQSEIRSMLNAICQDRNVLFESSSGGFKVQWIKKKQGSFWIARDTGSYRFGVKKYENHRTTAALSFRELMNDETNPMNSLKEHFKGSEGQKTMLWKFLTQQDYFKGLENNAHEAVLVHLLRNYGDVLNPDPDKTSCNDRLKRKIRMLYDDKSVKIGQETLTNFSTIVERYVKGIKHIFTASLPADPGDAMPIFFYAHVYYVCMYMIHAGNFGSDNTRENWKNVHIQDEKYAPDYVTIRYDLQEASVSGAVAKALKYLKCLEYLCSTPAGNYDNDEHDGMLSSVKEDMDSLDSEGFNITLAEIESDSLRDDDKFKNFTKSIQDEMTKMKTAENEHNFFMNEFFEGTNFNFISIMNFKFDDVVSLMPIDRQEFSEKIDENIHKLGLLMKLHCNQLMAEMEIVMKGPLKRELVSYWTEKNNNPTIKSLLQISEGVFHTEINPILGADSGTESVWSRRHVWFHEDECQWILNTFLCLRDWGIFRHEPFQMRMYPKTGEFTTLPKPSLYLTADNPLESDESELWSELYKQCCLDNKVMSIDTKKNIFTDFVKLDEKRYEWLKKLDSNGLSTKQELYWNSAKCMLHPGDKPYLECKICQQQRRDEVKGLDERYRDKEAILKSKSLHKKAFSIAWNWKYLMISRLQMIASQYLVHLSLSQCNNEDKEGKDLQRKLEDFNKLEDADEVMSGSG